MSYKDIYLLKSATIYSSLENKNTGRDEILEVQGAPVSRVLLQGNISEIREWVDQNPSYTAVLRLGYSNLTGVQGDTVLNLHPVSQSWQPGLGKKDDTYQVNGGVTWVSSSNTESWKDKGGTYLTSSFDSGSIFYEQDSYWLEIPLTNTLPSGTVPEYGWLLKLENESNSTVKANWFSTNTHTIYPPHIRIYYNDFQYNTGSFTQADPNEELIVTLRGTLDFKSEESPKLNFTVFPRYKPRQYYTGSLEFESTKILPEKTYYKIVDASNGQIHQPIHKVYTQVSADPELGSYINLNCSNYAPGRNYRLELYTEKNNSLQFLNSFLFYITS